MHFTYFLAAIADLVHYLSICEHSFILEITSENGIRYVVFRFGMYPFSAEMTQHFGYHNFSPSIKWFIKGLTFRFTKTISTSILSTRVNEFLYHQFSILYNVHLPSALVFHKCAKMRFANNKMLKMEGKNDSLEFDTNTT